MLTAEERDDLETSLEALLGPGNKRTLMTLLQPSERTDVATRGDVAFVRADVEGLRGEVGELRTDVEGLRGEVGDLRTGVKTEAHVLRAGMETANADLRSELYDAMRQQTLALVATMVTISGLTFAATALLN